MNHRCTRSFFLRLTRFSVPAALYLFTLTAFAANSLKLLDNPGGGQIVYGPVNDQSTLPTAMGAMLRAVHGHFGERPQIGRFFQTKGSNSLATFFTVTAKTGGGQKVAGLVIVSQTPGSAPAGAVIYDNADRFGTTANPMMKKLNEVWHPEGEEKAAAGHDAAHPAASPGKAAPLTQTPFPDNSGTIGLPAGWRITGGGQGQVHAEGPNGEQIHYGVSIPVMDPTNPQTRQMIQMETQGGRVPLPGSYVAYPAGGDPVRAFVDISAQTAQKYRQPVPTYHFTKTQDVGPSPAGNCTLAEGDVDRHDGKGLLTAATTICTSQFAPGNWLMTLYQQAAPAQFAAQEAATMQAIAMSYKLNNAVINSETQANVAAIQQIGHDAVQRSRDSEAAFEGQIAAHNANEDRVDRSNQAFSNYLLDQTVVQDTQNGERGTVYNKYADSLVQADPNRYQYVPTQDMLKGVDY